MNQTTSTSGLGRIQPTELSRCLFNEANDAFFIVDPASLRVLDANAIAQRLTDLE